MLEGEKIFMYPIVSDILYHHFNSGTGPYPEIENRLVVNLISVKVHGFLLIDYENID